MNTYEDTTKKNRFTMIGILFIAYISILCCNNDQIILYGGYALVISTLIIRLMFGDNGRLIIPAYTKRLFWFVMYSTLSLFWAYNAKLVFDQIPLLIASVILVIFMGDYTIKKECTEVILFGIAMCGFALAIYVIVDYGGIVEFYNQATLMDGSLEAQRMGRDIANVNTIGMNCIISSTIFLYYAIFKSKKLCYILMIVPFITAMATGSRKVILLMVVGVVILMYYKMISGNGSFINRYIKLYFGLTLLIVLIVFLLSLDISQVAMERLVSSFGVFEEGAKTDGSAQLRYDMIIIGIKKSFVHPFIGWGLGNSKIVNAIYLNHAMYSHCDYVEVMLNGGVIGFLLYYGLIYKLLKEHMRLLKENPADSIVLISLVILILRLIANLASVSYYESIQTYVYFILWISVLELRKRRELNESDI